MRYPTLVVGAGLALGLAAAPAAPVEPGTYQSPYSVAFTVAEKDLIGDLEGARGDWRRESSIPHDDWYSEKVRKGYGAWGAPARHYPAPEGIADRSLTWKRERVIAVGLRYKGYTYQHHHIPDWDPPRDWPWKEVANGRNAKGVDCSNFSSFVYNQGFGIKPSSAIKEQAKALDIAGPGDTTEIRAKTVKLPAEYEDFAKTLHTGDLLYIRNRQEEISHVVLWVGSIGKSPDDVPLILDSHGEGVKDDKGNAIPNGVQLRPFRKNSWVHKSASHAHRILLKP